MVRPESPRSASITEIREPSHPSRAASSTRAYWRAVDSWWSRTCAMLDWRTYTTAARSRWAAVILAAAVIAESCRERCLDHVGHYHYRVPPHPRHDYDRSVQLAPPQQLQIDLGDLRQRRLHLCGQFDALAHRIRQLGRHVEQTAAAAWLAQS